MTNIMCIVNIIKNERVKRDFTENKISTLAELNIDDYLLFENHDTNIEADKMIKVISIIGINHRYLYGVLKSFMLSFKTIDEYALAENIKIDLKESIAKSCMLNTSKIKEN